MDLYKASVVVLHNVKLRTICQTTINKPLIFIKIPYLLLKSCIREPKNDHYVKGRANEEALGRLFEAKGFRASLSAGSQGPVDLVTIRPCVKFGIQVKTTSNPKYSISKKDVNKIYEYCNNIGAVPFLAVVTKDLDELLSVSTYSINEHCVTDIVDICGNLIAFRLDTDYVCILYNLITGERMNYDCL